MSNNGNTRPTLLPAYINTPWWQYNNSQLEDAAFYKTSSVEQNVTSGTQTSTTFNTDFAAFLGYKDGYITVVGPGGLIENYEMDSTPAIGLAKVKNANTGLNDFYILRNNGRVDKFSGITGATGSNMWSITTGTTLFSSAKCIWSDGASVFLGGSSFLVSLLNQNTIAATYTTSETIVSGASCGPNTIVATLSGKLFNIANSTLSLLASDGGYGELASFGNKILVPIPSTYKIRIYNLSLGIVNELDTGNHVPFAVSSGRNNFAVTSYNSPDVLLYSDFINSPVTYTLANNVTYATPFSKTELLCSDLLSEFTTTVTPNVPISNLVIPNWISPPNVDTGTGDYVVSTTKTNLSVSAAPNMTVMINGQTGQTTINNGQRIAGYLRTVLGKQSSAFVVDNTAFDFVVDAITPSSGSRYIAIPVQPMSSQVVVEFTIPTGTTSAPITASHGSLMINGTPHSGSTLVNSGDQITLTIQPYANAIQYWGVVNVADSQFAVVINNNPTTIVDTEDGQPTDSLTTQSPVTVTETGLYYFPNYTTGSVSKNGVVLEFPIALNANDNLVVTHEQMSSFMNDERDTYLMGPTKNYEVVGSTGVGDQPNLVDFGTIVDGIPGFVSQAPNTITIQGLASDYSTTIQASNVEFSVNGGALTATPQVQNGDQVIAYYTVQNLYDNLVVYSTKLDGSLFAFGTIEMQTPVAEWLVVAQDYETSDVWEVFETFTPISVITAMASIVPASFITTLASVGKSDTPASVLNTIAPQGESQVPSNVLSFNAPTAEYDRPNLALPSAAPIGKTVANNNDMEGTMSVPSPRIVSTYTSNQILSKTIVSPSYSPVDTLSRFYPYSTYSLYTFYHTAEKFTPYTFTGYQPPYIKGEREWFRTFSPDWIQISAEGQDPIFLVEPVYFPLGVDNFVHVTKIYEVLANSTFGLVDKQYEFIGEQYNEFTFGAEVFNRATYTSETIMGKSAPVATAASVGGPYGFYAVEPQWNYDVADKVGGFDTADQAQLYAQTYYATLTATTYRQPEGTFSFILSQDTGLVCKVTDTGLKSVNWLIGGG